MVKILKMKNVLADERRIIENEREISKQTSDNLVELKKFMSKDSNLFGRIKF